MVLTGPEFSILFPYEEEGCCLRRLRGSDVSFLEVFLDELIKFLFFFWGDVVDFRALRYKSFFQLNLVIPRSGAGEVRGGLLVEYAKELVIFRGNHFFQCLLFLLFFVLLSECLGGSGLGANVEVSDFFDREVVEFSGVQGG